MCVRAASRSWAVASLPVNNRRTATVIIAGLGAGIAGTTLFVVIHSFLIFPIWTRFGGHFPFALLAGIGLAGAFDQAACLSRWRSVRDGARFGVLMFATLAPATAFSNALRLAGIGANEWPGVVGTLTLAMASGAAGGWLVTRRRRGALAFAAATLGLTIVMGGAIPVVNGPRAAWLYLGFLPICIGAGVTLAFARSRLIREAS